MISILFVLQGMQTKAQNNNIERTEEGFVVLELFTSEGCSSCPPAEALLEKIQEEYKDKAVYILVYHVDYWDHQGWKDRFSDKKYTNRQRQYAQWFKLWSLYTPQLVINGKTEHVGADKQSIIKYINNELTRKPTASLLIKTRIENHKLYITHNASKKDKQHELFLFLVQKNGQSEVKAGENIGRNLRHIQIVSLIQKLQLDGNMELELALPKGFNQKNWEVIGYIQHKKTGQISQAGRQGFNI